MSSRKRLSLGLVYFSRAINPLNTRRFRCIKDNFLPSPRQSAIEPYMNIKANVPSLCLVLIHTSVSGLVIKENDNHYDIDTTFTEQEFVRYLRSIQNLVNELQPTLRGPSEPTHHTITLLRLSTEREAATVSSHSKSARFREHITPYYRIFPESVIKLIGVSY